MEEGSSYYRGFEHKTRKGPTLHRVDCRMTISTISQLVNIQLEIVVERARVSDLPMRAEFNHEL